MDSWFIKQPESGKHFSDIDAGSSTEESHGSAVKKRRVRKYQTDFLMFDFTYQLVNREERPQCTVRSEVLTNNNLNAKYQHRHLKTRHASLANKPLKFLNENC
jgi:hypothetical protein